MTLQLAALEFQELGYRKESDRLRAVSTAHQHAEALAAWARDYLADIDTGIQVLDVDPETLSKDAWAWDRLWGEVGAGRFLEKYRGDELAAMRWAILEERRRAVRTLIRKVIVSKKADGSNLCPPPPRS